MEVKHISEENGGEFVIEQNEEKVGYMRYILFGSGRLVIQHTEVSKELQGTGASRELLAAAVQHARDNSLKIVPICPFAKAVMTKNRDKYADVLAG